MSIETNAGVGSRATRRWLVVALVGVPAACLLAFAIIVAAMTRSLVAPSASRQGEVAAGFARALVAHRYDQAHGMLSTSLAAHTPPEALRRAYESMIDYGDGPATDVRVVIVLDYWPDKLPGDVGWAYAAIWGPEFNEAVSVIVARENGRDVIRHLEWGRP